MPPPFEKLSSVTGDNLQETELRLGLPGSGPTNRPKGYASGAKRGFFDAIDGSKNWGFCVNVVGSDAEMENDDAAFYSPRAGAQEKKTQGLPNAKAQVVGWPPIRSYRKNTMATNPMKNKEDGERKQGVGCLYIKVSMDGAPYLRKVDLGNYCSYKELSAALEKMFSGFTMGRCGENGIPSRDGLSERCLMDLLSGSECVLTYEDRDGDWMLVGDVPWEMFIDSCKRLRIMKGSDAIGLAPRVMEKSRNRK